MSLQRTKIALAAIVVFFVLATAYIAAVIVWRQEALREVSRYNTSWLASQAVNEFTRLEQRITAFAMPGSGVTKDDVELRFEILLNRMNLLNAGEFQDFVTKDAERVAIVREFNDLVLAAQPLIEQLESPGAAARALAMLAPLEPKLASLASAANRHGAENVAEDQRELIRLHWLFTILAGGLIVCGITLILMLFWHNRMLERARLELAMLAGDLESNSELLKTTLNSIDQGLVMFDSSDTVKICNRRAREILNLSPESMPTRAAFNSIHQHQRQEDGVTELHTTHREAGEPKLLADEKSRIEEQRTFDGRVIEVRRSALSAGGEVLTYTDVTARKAAEHAKDNFLATMSHEIRTPLTGLLGMTDLLAADDLSEKHTRYVQNIKNSGRHLLAVVSDVLDFSRIEAGKLELEAVSFSMIDVLENVRSMLFPEAAERGLQMLIDVEDCPPPPVRGDPTRLAQVLINLVGNGIKFTQQGEVRIRLIHEVVDGGRVKLQVHVHDTGAGFPIEKEAQLFEPFVQADSSMTRRYGGSGLGLAISKRLLDAMGGVIEFDSIPGVGSHFWFELTLEQGEATTALVHETKSPPKVACKRILVAEDVTLNRDLLSAVLSKQGHEVVFAQNGAEAVELVKQGRFDIVLMDVQMPVMDGVEATRRIRKLPGSRRKVTIVGLTANVIASDRERYLAAGMDDCLTKPIDWDKLFAALGRPAHSRARIYGAMA
jgi:signal transduction histidine kinase/ActR/RegA family two-component response regulator